MNCVSDILKAKGSDLCTISPTATVYVGLQLMAEKDVGAILIVEDGQLIGIFTERDYSRKVILKGKSSLTTPIKKLMVRDILYVSPSDTIDDCMAIMTEKQIRHLPVMQEGELVGLVSMRDVVKSRYFS